MPATITYGTISDLANGLLEFYVRGDALYQSVQDKPLLRILTENAMEFPGGKEYISSPVQGAFMKATSGFFAGYSGVDLLTFTQATNLLRCQYPWKEVAAGLKISYSELKQDGISVSENGSTSDHSRADEVRLTDLFKNRMNDFVESWAQSMNEMLWKDGTGDAKQVPGMKYLLPDNNVTGTLGSLSRTTYTWWRHRVNLSLTPSPADQTMTKTLRRELRQLTRYGGKPNVALCGSTFIDALEAEVHEKGQYTQEGFLNSGKTNIGMADISLRGLGRFQYDPTLDSLGEDKRCYVFDTRRLKLRPMSGEANKLISPERPYDQLVFLRTMTWTGGLELTQPNACGVYAIA